MLYISLDMVYISPANDFLHTHVPDGSMRKNSKILSIQALRGIAAVLVVIFHARPGLVLYKDACLYPSWLNCFQLTRELGAFGVDLFFVISGVVFTVVLWDVFAKPHTVPLFLKIRIIRIFPLYWIFLAAWAGLFFVKSGAGKEFFNAEEVAFSFFLLPWPDGSYRGAYTLFVAWALSYELYFYLLVAACLCFARRYFLPLICSAVVAGNVFLLPSARLLVQPRPGIMRSGSRLSEASRENSYPRFTA